MRITLKASHILLPTQQWYVSKRLLRLVPLITFTHFPDSAIKISQKNT